ncbi:MAG: hypothetical protein WKF89_11365 [Chitinophagaceae bacterium]
MPPDFDFFEELEMMAASRKPCEITFMKDGGRSIIHGTISDAYVEGAQTFIRMDSGLEIEMNLLLEVNGIRQTGAC